MKIYKVGGAVRDSFLGVRADDNDWVVIGSSPEEMVAQGYKPIGRDFPVFLHPETNEEYALARTEKKSGTGYHGFTFYFGKDVTLEQDLYRRDFTINAMAEDEKKARDVGCNDFTTKPIDFPLLIEKIEKFLNKTN